MIPGIDPKVDIAFKRIFGRLEGTDLTISLINAVLGSPRKVRRFALAFEDHAANAPFSVRIETTPNGKRYVRV